MGMVAARAGDWPLARTLLARIRGADADQPAVLQAKAAVELALDTPSAAERYAALLVEQQPDNVVGRRLLALAQVRGDNPRGAMMTLDPITIRADADSWSLLLLSNSFSGLEWQADARQPLDRASRLVRGDAPPLPAAMNASASLDPKVAIPTIRALLARGEGAAALSIATRLADANPGVAQARLLVGDAAMMVGDSRAAAAQFRRASALRYDEPVMLRLVHALVRSGDREGAGEAIRQFQMRWPENVAAMRTAASFAAEQGDWTGSAAQLRAALARTGPNDALLLAQLARCEVELGDAGSALAYARRAYRLLPGNATISGVYGFALAKAGGPTQDARDLLSKAVNLAPEDLLLRSWHDEVLGSGR
jgi:tetratricopeptide (TPR) repeat protein